MTIDRLPGRGSQWRDAGLRGFSGLMAAFCGLSGIVLAAMIAAGLASGAYSHLTGANVDWTKGKAETSVTLRSSLNKTICSPMPNGGAKCQKSTDGISLSEAAPSFFGSLVAATPGFALVYGLLQATLCFVGLASGAYLHRATVSRLKKFAVAGLIFLFANPIAGVLGRLAAYLTYHVIRVASGKDGFAWFGNFERTYEGVNDILVPIYAVTLTIIALVMVRASRIAEDHAQIV
ncbi:hypothetical protein AS593_22720 [Caulobacter vibrioides]|nr:hypothetical protein AS593_22720 [Caulobacter vibrioides]